MNNQIHFLMFFQSAPTQLALTFDFAQVFKKKRVHSRCLISPLLGSKSFRIKNFQAIHIVITNHPNISQNAQSLTLSDLISSPFLLQICFANSIMEPDSFPNAVTILSPLQMQLDYFVNTILYYFMFHAKRQEKCDNIDQTDLQKTRWKL